MSTAGDLITRALRRARIIGVDVTPSAEDMDTGLDSLNDLLDTWWLERLAVYRINQESFSWASGNASRTIGAAGNFVANRPVEVTGALFNDGTQDTPVFLLSREEYDAIPIKTQTGVPSALFYDPTYPSGTLYAYPVPSATYTLKLNSHQRIESFADKDETADLPPGYNRAVITNLAVELCDEFGAQPSQALVRAASTSKRALKRVNAVVGVLTMPSVLGAAQFDILTGP